MRAYRKCRLSEDEMNELVDLIHNEEFISLPGTYEYLEEEPQTVKEITTITTGDMILHLDIDFVDVQKSIIADRFTSPDRGMTYPAMPYPLDDIYKTLKSIAENKTEELYRKEIPG